MLNHDRSLCWNPVKYQFGVLPARCTATSFHFFMDEPLCTWKLLFRVTRYFYMLTSYCAPMHAAVLRGALSQPLFGSWVLCVVHVLLDISRYLSRHSRYAGARSAVAVFMLIYNVSTLSRYAGARSAVAVIMCLYNCQGCTGRKPFRQHPLQCPCSTSSLLSINLYAFDC
jgi:hypothetical protein